MAVIGPMRKLTIGNKTYQIVTGADSLPIASTSTLGAIKVGTGLTIDSSTGVLNATGTSLVIDNELSGTSTNPVQNKVIKTALDNKADSDDIPTKVSDLTNDSGFTSNTGTVTSVRVQATSPVQSSTSTAQNSSLNTTISLADGYGDTKNPYGTKTANYVLAGPSSGNAAAPSFRELVASDIPDLSETYLTSFTETDPVFSASVAHGITSSDISNWNGKTSLTIGTSSTTAAAGNHVHGNITNGGDITTTATIANGDRLIINDESASKVTNSSITFGTNASKYLSNAGTWGDIPTTLPASDVSDWAKADTKPSYTASQVGAAASSHTHGNITNGGDITATAPTIANGDQIIINDNSDSKITNGPTFDGSTTTKALTPKGTWETFATSNTDEKLKTYNNYNTEGYVYPLIFGNVTNNAETKYYSNYLTINQYDVDDVHNVTLDIGGVSEAGQISLSDKSSNANNRIIIKTPDSLTQQQQIILPDATGTIALTSNLPDISGKIDTAGTGLSKSGTTLNHSNSVTAQTTQAIYPIKIDAQGHISEYGNAVNIPTKVSDLINDSGFTSNTGTVTSVGLSNATNGGLSISGSPITSSGSITIGHSNILTSAQTTQAVYPIKIDKNGHISDYGSAVTISDTKVTQSAAITTAGQYPVILGYNTGTAAVTNTVNKSANLTYNPSTNELTNAGGITCGSLDDNYGLNDSALLYQTTMDKWKLILGIEDQEEQET